MYYPLAQQEFESYLNGYDRAAEQAEKAGVGHAQHKEKCSFSRRHRPCKADCTPSRHRAF